MIDKTIERLRTIALERPHDERLAMPPARVERHDLALLIGYVDGLRKGKDELKLLIEPLEMMALIFEEGMTDEKVSTVETEMLRQLCGSVRALSKQIRGEDLQSAGGVRPKDA